MNGLFQVLGIQKWIKQMGFLLFETTFNGTRKGKNKQHKCMKYTTTLNSMIMISNEEGTGECLSSRQF